MTMDNYSIYQKDIPDCIKDCLKSPEMIRLQNVGMNCGCEYTSFPRFKNLAQYSRYDHSLGVALIIWHFTKEPAQAIAGLLHDVATPVFAHVVDFLYGDYMTQESTEHGTKELIMGSDGLQDVLKALGLTTEDVCDYHIYPIADNDTPRLSADRLEYTIGNSINYGICAYAQAQEFYKDLVVGGNEDGIDELMFTRKSVAEDFSNAALACSEIYVSDEDRYSMQLLSEILRLLLDKHVIDEEALYTTEPEVIRSIRSEPQAASLWDALCAYERTIRAAAPEETGQWRKIFAKKRHIDPMVKGEGRLSSLSVQFKEKLDGFLNSSHDVWICGV